MIINTLNTNFAYTNGTPASDKRRCNTQRGIQRILGLICFSLLVTVLSGCGADSGVNIIPGSQSATQQQFTIDEKGGTIEYRSTIEDVIVTLTFPPGALSGSTVITIDHAQSYPAGTGLVSGAVFDFGPEGLMFNVPVDISIDYSASMVGALPEENFRIHEASNSGWIPLLGSVDTVNTIVKASIGGFSIYGLKAIPNGGTDPSSIIPTWYGIQANIFDKFCTGCHNNANPMQGLSWDVDQYSTIVTDGWTSSTGLLEIDPGSPETSYMYLKITGDLSIGGGRMPLGGDALDPALIAVIEQWILDDAPLGVPEDAASGGSTVPGTGGGADTWETIQADILQDRCVICHYNQTSIQMGLSWEADQYDEVVTSGRASIGMPTLKLIEPGSSATSYMAWKINGQGPGGEDIVDKRMPASGPPYLDQVDIGRITAWIDAGAPGMSTAPEPDPSEIIPTWYGIQANILDKYCTGCHSGSSPQAGLSWEVGQYDTIVTGGWTSSTELLEIVPGSPETSYMYLKITDDDSISGSFMPATGTMLDQALIDVIRQWILDGAPLGVPEDATSGGSSGPTYPVGSWMYVWTESLQVCTMCHSPAHSSPRCGDDFDCPPKGIVLTADNYNGVVDGDIVDPGNLNGSELCEMVTESKPDKRMPYGMDPLSQSQLDIIENWIRDDAPLCPDEEVCP